MLKKLDARMKKLLLIIVGGFVFLILVAIIIFLVLNRKLTFDKVEMKMVEGAEKYFATNSTRLPQIVGNYTEVKLDELVSGGYMKPVSKYVKDDNISCSGRVVVTKSGTFYNYSPYLNCGNYYVTSFLKDQLKKTVVTNSDGLYEMTQINIGPNKEKNQAKNYVFRGDYVNNYIKIDNNVWRVVKIDSNDNIMVIYDELKFEDVWDDRFNKEINRDTGINDYEVSRAKKRISDIYAGADFSDNLKRKFIPYDVCVGKRSEEDVINDGSIECSKILSEQYFALMPVYDYINASLDSACKKIIDVQCKNYNYLTKFRYASWAFVTGNKNKSEQVYSSNEGVGLGSYEARGKFILRITGYLNKNVRIISGTGTSEDPYIVE